jgi:hypothetical protein
MVPITADAQIQRGFYGHTATPFVEWVDFGYNVIATSYSPTVAVVRNLRPEQEARQERERRRVVVHMPPPVVLALCTEPMPEKRVHEHPRGVAWLAAAQSGQRERRALRSRIERKDAA